MTQEGQRMSDNELLENFDSHCLSLPFDQSAFDTVTQIMFNEAGNTHTVRRALLACDEWIANVTSYSGGSVLRFLFLPEKDCLTVIFEDNGAPFDPTAADKDMPAFDELYTGGMGVGIIIETSDETTWKRLNGCNYLLLKFKVT